MNKFILVVCAVILWGCGIDNNADEGLLIDETEGLSKNQELDVTKLEILKSKAIDAIFDKDDLWYAWNIRNVSDSPKEFSLISRTLHDHELCFYLFDKAGVLKEKKRIAWGISAQEREKNTYFPVKTIFIDSGEAVEVTVAINRSYRKPIKGIFELSYKKIDNEITIRKIIDAITTAFLGINIFFSLWYLLQVKLSISQKRIIQYYFFYNIFTFIFYFFRYFIFYNNSFTVPAFFNLTIDFFSLWAVYCYYCFGVRFIDKDKQNNFHTHQKVVLILILICWLRLFFPNNAFNPPMLIFRIIVLVGIFGSCYYEAFRRIKEPYARLFIIISLPMMFSGLLNMIYANLGGLLFQNKYAPEITKLAVGIESMMMFGGYIWRNRNKKL